MHRELMRNALLDLTTIMPATTCHRRSYVETYSRYMIDKRIAPALKAGLHRFAKPWYSLRALRIFYDEATLSANPSLWTSIQAALEQSEFFILLASPEAALSKWVKQEINYWLL